MRRFFLCWLGLSAALYATDNISPAPQPASAIQLTARMINSRDVMLDWTDRANDAAGHIVEYINHPTDSWVILGFFPPAQHTFIHPRLAPGTPYSYRVRPFHGPASTPIEVTIAQGLSDKAYADAYALPEDYSWAPPQKTTPAGAGLIARKSIRDPRTAKDAGPTNLVAQVIKTTVSGFKLTWTDHATDEEGFLIERVDSPTDFTVCAVVEPDVNAFGWALEPPVRKGVFRVRAYYYGASSSVASMVTPPEPDDLPRARTSSAASKPKG
jgi:hypothetical protein